ncbi:MAG TPA: outer membrane beta-barrel protein [Stellaceae bacterium]|nr:outer membrane beta-barrel protein [Stellaceae bacterium]
MRSSGGRSTSAARTRRALGSAAAALLGALAALAAGLAPACAQLVPGITQLEIPRPNANPLAAGGPVGVTERLRPEYDPLGFPTAQGFFYPSVTGTVLYDDNVFASQSAQADDLVMHLRPAFTFQSRRDTLSYIAGGYGDFAHYLGHESLSNSNAGATLGVIQEIGRDWEIESQSGAKYDHQDPSSFASPVPNTAISHLPAYTILSEQVSATRRVDRLSLSFGGGYQREDYQNVVVGGVLIKESDLDANAFSMTSRLGYAVTPLTRIFAEGEYLRRDYDNGVLNSNTVTTIVGTDFEFRRLTRGTVFAGIRQRQYDSALIGSLAAPTFGINLEWFPTRLLTFTAVGRQDFADTPITTPTGGSAVVDIKTLQFEGDYEILRQLIGTAVAGFESDNYSLTNRTDKTLSLGLSLTYMLNRNLRLIGQYRITDRQSSLAGFSYVRDEIGIGLKTQY